MKFDDIKTYTEANRAAWNETMPKHQEASKEKIDKRFSDPEYIEQSGVELEKLKEVGIEGKNIAHISCNNGTELLSLKRMGAGRCVGFDISDEAIKEAQERAKSFDIDCKYVATDVFEIEETYYNSFDIVYITVGALGWIPHLKGYVSVANNLLKKGGKIFIYEMHPFCDMIPTDDIDDVDRLKIIEPYFRAEPYEDNDGIDYIGNTTYEAKTSYWFVHTMSDIIMSFVSNNIGIEYFKEYDQDISMVHTKTEQEDAAIPLSYILIGSK